MAKNNVVFNLSLDQYNKKYRNRKHRLLKFTKKEVEQFDRVNNTSNKFLLGMHHRKWAYIDGTYYEIPRAPRFTWFRNLHAGVQIGTCVFAAGVVAAAVTIPIVLLNQQNICYEVTKEEWEKSFESIVDYTKQRNVTLHYESKTLINDPATYGLIMTAKQKLEVVNSTEHAEEAVTSEMRDNQTGETMSLGTQKIIYYNKYENNKILLNKKINDSFTGWEEDSDFRTGYITALRVAAVDFDSFKFENNEYVLELDQNEESVTMKLKVIFENKKLCKLTSEMSMDSPSNAVVETMTKTDTITFDNYGTTSFTLPE